MTPVEAGELLVLIATFDQRPVEDGDAESWARILGNMSLATARAAVEAHYGTTHRRVMPSDVWALVRANAPEVLGEQQGKCPFRGCPCTHTDPCDRGWIDGGGTIRACPTCRPEQARIVREAPDEPGVIRLAALRDRSRFAAKS